MRISLSLSLSRPSSKADRASFSCSSAHHALDNLNPLTTFILPITLMRPRPPVRSTLSASHTKPSPPPPYGDALTSPEANTLSLSESATAHRIHALAKDVFSGAVPSAIEECINGRSREELSSLLVRANELIRERERGKSSLDAFST